MMYHALSLAKHGFLLDVIAYSGKLYQSDLISIYLIMLITLLFDSWVFFMLTFSVLGSKPGRLLNNPNINFHCINDFACFNECKSPLNYWIRHSYTGSFCFLLLDPKFVSHIFRPFFHSFLLLFTLFYTLIKPDFILVQVTVFSHLFFLINHSLDYFSTITVC